MNLIENKKQIIKDQLLKIVDSRIAYGKKLIEQELTKSLFDIVAKPVVNAFYNYWSKEARRGILHQINIILKCAQEALMNNSDEIQLKTEANNVFPDYMKGDQLAKMCKKNHKNYKKLSEIIREVFIFQIKESLALLKVEGDFKDYDNLIRAAFKTKDEAYKTLSKQLDSYDGCLRLMGSDLSILTFPTGRKRIYNVLKKGSEESNNQFLRDLEKTYLQA